MEIYKDKGLQVILKIRGRARCSEVKKAISCAPTRLLLVHQFASRFDNPTRMICFAGGDAHAKCPKPCKFSYCFIVRYVIYNNMHIYRTVE